MGRRISKEFLHPSILEGVNNKIGNLDSLETDAKGNMVQAINELVEKLDNSAEIENGKELIANAVGEPLTAEKSFDEMSNDINSLLSTFKTNMMNNGVTVNSSDRFKQLIDKIATMVEEGSGKGIQFVEGKITNIDELLTKTCTAVMFSGNTYAQGGDYKYKCFSLENLGFKPSIVVVYSVINNGNTYVHGVYNDFCGKDYCESGWGWDQWNNRYNYYSSRYMDFMKTEPLAIPIYQINTTISSIDISYYAIGVGEEDTTLRDSLASILQEEGVSVTEEDDMTSLITKVDEEFTKDNNTISSMKQELADALVEKGVDVNTENTFDELVDSLINMNVGEVFSGISCRSSLPAEVEDGHIIIITENYNKIYVDNKKIDKMNLSEGDVYIKYGLESPYTENLNNLDSPISIHLEVVYQMINNEIVFVDEIYKGVDGEWVKILDSRVYYFNEGVFKVSSSAFFVNGMSQ